MRNDFILLYYIVLYCIYTCTYMLLAVHTNQNRFQCDTKRLRVFLVPCTLTEQTREIQSYSRSTWEIQEDVLKSRPKFNSTARERKRNPHQWFPKASCLVVSLDQTILVPRVGRLVDESITTPSAICLPIGVNPGGWGVATPRFWVGWVVEGSQGGRSERGRGRVVKYYYILSLYSKYV